MEFLSQFWDEITILSTIVLGALGLRASIEKNTRAVADHSREIERLREAREKADQSLADALKEVSASLATGRELMRKLQETHSAEHREMVKTISAEHRELIAVVSETRLAVAKLEARTEAEGHAR